MVLILILTILVVPTIRTYKEGMLMIVVKDAALFPPNIEFM